MDAHCHLSDTAFDPGRNEIYRDLIRNNVTGLVLAGTDPEDWARQESLDPPHPLRIAKVYGIHPWWVDKLTGPELEAAFESLKLRLSECQGIGELGVDFHRGKTADQRRKQRHWFEAQLKLAIPTDLPLVLHVVRGHHEVLPILRQQRRIFRGLVHAFWANKETAEAYIKLGFSLSIPPRIMKEDPHRILSELDPEHLVFETDTPFLDAENREVRPVFVKEMLEFVARARNEDLDAAVERQERLLTELFPALKETAR